MKANRKMVGWAGFSHTCLECSLSSMWFGCHRHAVCSQCQVHIVSYLNDSNSIQFYDVRSSARAH